MADRKGRDRDRNGAFDIDGSRNQQYGAGPTTEYNGLGAAPPSGFRGPGGGYGFDFGTSLDTPGVNAPGIDGPVDPSMTAPWGGVNESLGDVLDDIDRDRERTTPGMSKPTSMGPMSPGRTDVASALTSAFGGAAVGGGWANSAFGGFAPASYDGGSIGGNVTSAGMGSGVGPSSAEPDDPFGDGGWASEAFGGSEGGWGF